MTESKLGTKFAPPERASKKELDHELDQFRNNQALDGFLSKIPAIFLVVNKYRQVIYMNKGALEFTGLDEVTGVIGKRPGEIFDCIHSSEEEGGCGTSESCTYCGAINAILESQKGKSITMDCRLLVGSESTAYDLRVWASPLVLDDEEFTAITLQDIGHEKWHSFLERIFFHDILNSMTALYGNLQLINLQDHKSDSVELTKKTEMVTKMIIDEIQSQQLLLAAENKNLVPSTTRFDTSDLLKEVHDLYTNQLLTSGKTIEIAPSSENYQFNSDHAILRRILSNMVKNALEATPEGDKVTIGCEQIEGNLRFWVHNPGYIPREIQLQIFKRSFSTKGIGRGLGTYSMKLLSSILKCSVSFTSSRENGTIFNATFPIS